MTSLAPFPLFLNNLAAGDTSQGLRYGHVASMRTLYSALQARGKQLADIKAIPSMSRTGCCYDAGPMESFFHTLKVELVHQRRWATRDEARRDLFAYIEGYYNRLRIHSALRCLTPWQAEQSAS